MDRRSFLKSGGKVAVIGSMSALFFHLSSGYAPAQAAAVATSTGISNISVVNHNADATSASTYSVISWIDSKGKIHSVRVDMNSDEAWVFAVATAIKNGTLA